MPTPYFVYVISDLNDRIIEVFTEDANSPRESIDAEYPDCTVTQVLDEQLSYSDAGKLVRNLKSAYGLCPQRQLMKNNLLRVAFIDRHPPGDRNGFVRHLGVGTRQEPLCK